MHECVNPHEDESAWVIYHSGGTRFRLMEAQDMSEYVRLVDAERVKEEPHPCHPWSEVPAVKVRGPTGEPCWYLVWFKVRTQVVQVKEPAEAPAGI
jgi:hypothetical protein